jgi:polyphosphate kinase 2
MNMKKNENKKNEKKVVEKNKIKKNEKKIIQKDEIKNKEVKKDYKEILHGLQVELVKLQKHIIENNFQILIILEGRDAAGKDGAIKRITQHLSPRETRVVALGKPSDQDRNSWYFQRYVAHLPSKQEIVILNRSWYNRAGVERVMGYCSDAEYEDFMSAVVPFEQMLVKSGIQIFKYYLDISKKEQEERLQSRREDPLKQWKISPIDESAQKLWKDYSDARDEMLMGTHNSATPWYVVRADDKKETRLNIIAHLMAHVDCPDKDKHGAKYDPKQIFKFDKKHLKDGFIAP